ncbi:MAG: response regulator transcription factor [Chloroflexi bacterium]|nr:response regulator transcription factor [Chloroflexota bacterium]
MNAKILVVDDDEITLTSIAEILLTEGYFVVEASNGADALNILEQDDIDLMLLDIMMPGMSGIEVLRDVELISPETKVIMLTGNASLDTAVSALRHSAYDYISKPQGAQEILSRVANGLARRDEEKHKRILIAQIEDSIEQLKKAEGMTETVKYKRKVMSMPDGVMLDLARREIWRGNNKERLTPTEGKLLEVFVTSWGRVLTHGELVFLVQGYEVAEWEAPEVLRPLISRLRRKLATFPDGERWIASVRGTGYIFDADRPV